MYTLKSMIPGYRSPFKQFPTSHTFPWTWFSETEVEGTKSTTISRTDDRVIVRIDMPGYKMDDIDITLDDRVLIVRANRDKISEDETVISDDRTYSVDHRIRLKFSPGEPDAVITDGVLTISIPFEKSAKIPIRQITA